MIKSYLTDDKKTKGFHTLLCFFTYTTVFKTKIHCFLILIRPQNLKIQEVVIIL